MNTTITIGTRFEGGYGSGPVVAVKDRGGSMVDITVRVEDCVATCAHYLVPRSQVDPAAIRASEAARRVRTP